MSKQRVLELCSDAVANSNGGHAEFYGIKRLADAIRELALTETPVLHSESGTDRFTGRWMERRIGQLGIDARLSGAHEQMLEYIKLLEEELKITVQFLKEDGYSKPVTKASSNTTAPSKTGRVADRLGHDPVYPSSAKRAPRSSSRKSSKP